MLTTGGSHIQTNLWEEAMATLSYDDKTWIKHTTGDTLMPMHDVVDKMITLATERQRQCEQNGWKTVRLGGYRISPSDVASKTIIWLNKFKEIGDIIVQYDPVHAALPWAVARFILQAIVATEEQVAASLAIMERATRIIHRCQVYEELYNRKTVDHVVIENLESALIKLYACVLKGLVETSKYLLGSTPFRSFYAIFHPTAGSGLFASLEHGEAQVEREIIACVGQRRAKADARFQEQLRSLLELREPVLRADENIENVLQRLEWEELTRVLQWISPIEYRRHHDTINELRAKNTCNWLLKRHKFGQWSSATSSMTLWLQGLPGSGKTYLTSKIIEGIEATLNGKENDESFAFFYCNRNEEDRRDALAILRSYIRQLSTTPQRSGFIYPELKQLYADSQLKGSGWTLGLCQEYLVKLFNLYPRTILVLDALDECKPEERASLLDFFDSIPSKTSKTVRIFISSRPEGDIRQRLIHLSSIEIQATDNEDDIATFVMQNIERNGRWRDTLQKNQPLKDKIVRTLLAQSNGMFQWAMLQIKQLLNLRTEREISNRLGKLPEDLKATYDEIYRNIETRQDTYVSVLSLRALQWVICAYKPLTSKELLAAVHVDPEEGIPNCFEATETDLLDWCANLLWVDSQQTPPVWRVSHLSVVEYLETRWTVPEAHCFVAKASLVLLRETYGGEHEQESKPDNIFHPDHELQIYVRHHWTSHVQTQEHQDADPKLADLLKAFLGPPEKSSVQYREWHRQIAFEDWKKPSSSAFRVIDIEQISPSTSSTFLVCCFSFYTLLRDWWDTVPIGLLQLADSGDDLLTLAAAAGCKPICTKLCELGILVNMPLQTGRYGSALAAAAYSGSTEIVQFLIDKGADINMSLQTGDFGSALAAAAYSESTETVQFLINKGADINMPLQTEDFGSALAAAAYRMSIEIVQLLVDKGADINMPLQTGNFGSALAAAAYRGSIDIVEFLIDKGADTNMLLQTRRYSSALMSAKY
ncbi:hypothetical protein HD806DRAFT_221669 [Xylariaceae sp. AK1471]|nr:hypothetical protein HD806DRAFT_221669 [Xylariaceae sp. AK1471]